LRAAGKGPGAVILLTRPPRRRNGIAVNRADKWGDMGRGVVRRGAGKRRALGTAAALNADEKNRAPGCVHGARPLAESTWGRKPTADRQK